MRPLRLNARWVLPIDSPPIPDAALLVGPDGRIAAIGPDPAVPVPESAERVDLGDAILLPGLVNAHTHLELTGFDDSPPDLDFRRWILSIRRLKEARSPEEYLAAARRGITDCWSGGVTTIADTGDSGAVIQALAELGGSGIAFQEVFGPHPSQVEESFDGLRRRTAELAAYAVGRVRLGVSPHAPYSVSGPLYARVAEWAARQHLGVAVHLAESPAESEFVSRGAGPFAEAWQARGIPQLVDRSQQPPGRPLQPASPVAWLDRLGVLGAGTLCIHAVQLSDDDIGCLSRRGVSIAHCPLANARHNHGTARLADLRRAGLRIGLGTDSVASVGRLDLFAEARAARDIARLGAAETLGLATVDGARALGLDAEIGTLGVGKWGDLTAVRAQGLDGVSPEDRALAASPSHVLLTALAGRVVYRPGPPA